MHQTIMQVENPVSPAQLERLRATAGPGPVLILTHDHPDPDGLASGKALAALFKAWAIPAHLVFHGLVGRAENRALHRYLTPEWEYAPGPGDSSPYSAIALVDSQPGAGNNSLLPGVVPDIVIDHHYPVREACWKVRYTDIRTNIGATVSMVYQYLEAAQVHLSAELATAMFFGLRADTLGLSRGATAADGVIYGKLLHALDHQLLLQVEQSGLSRAYFAAFSQGLQDAQIVGKTVFTFLGEMHRPDFVAEMADLLVRLEEVHAALCLGVYQNTLYISLRTGSLEQDAGLLIQQIVRPPGKAGGHGTIAGGQFPLTGDAVQRVVAEIQDKFLRVMHESGAAAPLLSQQ